ncbi:MAG: hypothetical protein M1484_04020 [Patescibacteria group bacterium]|nr:hypothetical protein [Patescibacteria group bacterium]MCL5432225.1 hypothetical protein [Patescibacteria group bacterium]
MTLSAEAISSFKEIYVTQFGEHLSDAEAEVKAIAMLKLFRLIYSEAAPRCWKNKLQMEGEVRKK